MAGISQYSKEEILFVLRRIVKKIRQSQIVDEYRKRFGKALNPNQIRYIKNKYGKDPDYGSPMINYRGGNASDLEDSDHAPEEQTSQKNNSTESRTQQTLLQHERQKRQEQPDIPRSTSNKPVNPGRLQNRRHDHHHPYDAQRRSNFQVIHREQPTSSAVASSSHVIRHDQRPENPGLNYTNLPSPRGVAGHQSHYVYHGHSSYPDYLNYPDPVPRLFTQDVSTQGGQVFPYPDGLIGNRYHEGVSAVQSGQMQLPVGAYMGFESGMIPGQWYGNSMIPMSQPFDPYMDPFPSSSGFTYTDNPPRGTVPPSLHLTQLYEDRQQAAPLQMDPGYGIIAGSWYPSMTGHDGQAIHQPIEQVKAHIETPQLVHQSTVPNANIGSMTVSTSPGTDPIPSRTGAKKRPRSPCEEEAQPPRPSKCIRTMDTNDTIATVNAPSTSAGLVEPHRCCNELPVGMHLGDAYRVKREMDISTGLVQPGLSPVPGDFVIPPEADVAYSKIPFRRNRLDSVARQRWAMAKAGLDVKELPGSPLDFSPISVASLSSSGPSADNEPNTADPEALDTTSANDNGIAGGAEEEGDAVPPSTVVVELEPQEEGVERHLETLDSIPGLLDDLIYWENEFGELEAFDLEAEFGPFPSDG